MGKGVAGGLQRVMHFFLPKEEDFFELFEAMAVKAHEGAGVLQRMLHGEAPAASFVEPIAVIEHAVDELNHDCVKRLKETFVTPIMFDRQDILALADDLDEIVDQTRATVDRMALYRPKTIPSGAVDLGDILVECTKALAEACGQLHAMRSADQGVIKAVNALENRGDQIVKQGLADLFEHEGDAVEVLKWKELYDHIEEAIDCCEDAVQTIEAALVKNS
jgi:uncharacterized protein Yka (UPF0111/DUF47 family)